jgi:phosphatidate cytidylyltransferase
VARVLTRNLATRVATGAVVLPLLVAAFFFGPSWLGVGIIAAACALAFHEYVALLRARGLAPVSLAGVIVLVATFVEVAWPAIGAPLLPLAVVAGVGFALQRAGTMESSLTAAATTFFGAAYLGTLGGCMAALLLLQPVHEGPWRIVLLMAVIMTSDSAALFAGQLWGRRKLAPAVSPGKTVAGAVGALVGALPPALLVRAYGLPGIPVRDAVLLGLGVAVAGLIGDLAESLMKRWAGIKDSGTLFPGHGGMLDRLDSLLFGAPVLYYYFLLAR